jgi:hypothetical protein
VAATLALAAAIATPAPAVEKARPSITTASAIAKAIGRLPGPLAGTTFELASLTQADFERLQPLADAVLWLPEQGKARFFSSRSSAFAGEGQKKVIAPSEDVSAFLERLSTDYPDLTAGNWVLVSPVRLEGPAPAVSVPSPAPAGPNLQGQPSPNAAAIIFHDDFEGSFATNWSISDNVGGTYQWGRRGCGDARGGTWSAGVAAGGSLGPTSLCTSTYPNNYTTFMARNSCDSVAGAATASLTSYYQVNSEAGRDYLIFAVPTTSGGSTYYGQGISGNYPGVWQLFTQDLRAWPSVGDLTARACVDLALVFQSDSSVTYATGAKVDDLAIGISTGGGVSPNCSPSAFTLCLFSNRFQVNATYDSYGSPSVYAVASATSVSDNTGYFTTATAGNVDVIVKMVNFCSSNNTWSAYIGGTTDLGVRIAITDKNTGSVYNASNPLGSGWVLIRDAAFTCP